VLLERTHELRQFRWAHFAETVPQKICAVLEVLQFDRQQTGLSKGTAQRAVYRMREVMARKPLLPYPKSRSVNLGKAFRPLTWEKSRFLEIS
jgi:hypothetical protein